MKRLLARFLVLLAATVGAASSQDPVYSVCELLANPQNFQGKYVRVRGIVASAGHGASLSSGNCPSTIEFGKRQYPSGLSLSYHSEFGPDPTRREAHMKTVEQQIKKMPRRMRTWALTITCEGIFETKKEWLVPKPGVGEGPFFGFGHMNYWPAQLVVVDMTDPIRVKKTPGRQ